MIYKMKAIDYNAWLTVIDKISADFKKVAIDYNIRNTDIPVLPSYPRDLSKFTKPSIIIQKVDISQSMIGFGGFIGQYFDRNNNTFMDVDGIEHTITFQIDVVGDSNTQSELMSAIITEEILNGTRINNNGIFKLNDYTKNPKTPIDMGYCKLIGDVDIIHLDSNENHDYIIAIRFDIIIVQTVVPNQDVVDLNKWVRYKQVIKI